MPHTPGVGDDDFALGYGPDPEQHRGHNCSADPESPNFAAAYRHGEPVMASPNTAWFCDRAKNIIGGGGQRHQDYGDALDSFEAIAVLWSVVLGTTVTAEQVALCQVMLKMGRLLNKPNHEDSWVDIIGYAALGGDIAMRPGRNGNL